MSLIVSYMKDINYYNLIIFLLDHHDFTMRWQPTIQFIDIYD